MVDERDVEPEQLGDPASPVIAPAGNPAEAQFPYAATHGVQASGTLPPSLSRRRPRRPLRRPWLIVAVAAIAGLLALALLAIDLTWGARPSFGPRSDAAATRTAHDYLEALAAGDAAKALGFALHPAADAGLLTDRMLAGLRATAPISEIAVDAPTEPGRVPVSYLLGTERVTTVFRLTLDGDAWRLDQVAAPIDLSSFAVPVTLNGVEPDTTRPALFPGHYRIAPRDPRYTVPDGEFTVLDPFGQPAIPATIDLSEAGRAEVIEAARAHLADCLSRRDLEPPGCGFAVVHPEQTPLDEATVEWSTPEADNFSDLAITLDHPGSASAEINLTVRGDVHGVDGSRWLAHVRLTRMRADLTGPVIQVQFG